MLYLNSMAKKYDYSQDEDADTLNYAALNFAERKTKRGRKKRDTPQESVYSDVRCSDWELNCFNYGTE